MQEKNDDRRGNRGQVRAVTCSRFQREMRSEMGHFRSYVTRLENRERTSLRHRGEMGFGLARKKSSRASRKKMITEVHEREREKTLMERVNTLPSGCT